MLVDLLLPRRGGAAEVAERRRAHDDELDGRARVGVAEAKLVRCVEAVGEVCVEVLVERLVGACKWDRQRVLLADVADVERVLDAAGVAADPLLLERGEALLLERAERRGEVVVVERRRAE